MSFKIVSFSKEHYNRNYLNTLSEVQMIEKVLADPNNTFSYDYAMVSEFTSDMNDNAIDTKNNWLFCIQN